MSEKIPYKQVMELMRIGNDYIADEAYQKGFEVGTHEAEKTRKELFQIAYDKGLNDAWECARKIAQQWEEETDTEHGVVIDDSIRITLDSMTASEAIAKLKAYEEQQKADDEIKVGDEVCFVFAGGETIEPFIVFSIKDDNGKKYYEGIQVSDGRWVGGGLKYYKTGRHFQQVAELLKAMKGGAE